jgi:hypothetical protein
VLPVRLAKLFVKNSSFALSVFTPGVLPSGTCRMPLMIHRSSTRRATGWFVGASGSKPFQQLESDVRHRFLDPIGFPP